MHDKAYYNENDPFAAQWLRNLIAEGLIAPGEVDSRSIVDVRSDDLAGFTQCHFFAGLGGWAGALRLAGFPDHRPVWTGSCPCQPFSLAGKQKGFSDERHLWPIWRELIAERRPPKVYGEQVASAADWLRLVRSDLEALEYAVGAIPIEAASAGADHLRDRYWFVGNAIGQGQLQSKGLEPDQRRRAGHASHLGDTAFLAEREPHHETNAESDGRKARSISGSAGAYGVGLADANDEGPQGRRLLSERSDKRIAGPDGVADTNIISSSEGRQQRSWQQRGIGGESETRNGHVPDTESEQARTSGQSWEHGGVEWVIGADGKARRVKPGIRLLAHGIPARVAKLRALGNAIDLRPAAAFIKATM